MAQFQASWDFSDWTLGRDGSSRIKGFVFFDPETEDEEDIENAAIAGLPSVYAGYVLNSVTLKPAGWNVFEAQGRYSALPSPDTSGSTPPEFSFEIGSENVKALIGFAKVSEGAVSGRDAPDHGGLIGVTDDGVDGVDVPQPVYSFSEVHHFNFAAITQAYKALLATALVGTVNATPFRGFAAGEVLSTGVSGSVQGADLWSMRYQFAVLPNVAGLTLGPLTGITKRGWDYLEVHYDEEEDTTLKLTLKKPYAYTVHQVLRYSNYALFGIGV